MSAPGPLRGISVARRSSFGRYPWRLLLGAQNERPFELLDFPHGPVISTV